MTSTARGATLLAPMLTPRSIAFVGASRRPGTPGNAVVRECLRGRFPGTIYPVNPRYEEVEGLACYTSLSDLPEAPDLVVLALGNAHLEAALADAIGAGARAGVIFESAFLPKDSDPPLFGRLKAMAEEAGFPICGPNCTGFINLDGRTRVAYAPHDHNVELGHATFLSHSGSSFGGFIRNERRLRFNLSVAPGKEIGATVADYMDFALELESTRVIGMMIEEVRDPERFVAALEKAAERDVPVVVLKVGRSPLGARLAQSHSGALAGDDAVFGALLDRHGALRMRDLDELLGTLLMFSDGRRAAAGGLGVVCDSGGERELFADLCHAADVPLAEIGGATKARLEAVIDPALEAANPVDAWGGPADYAAVFDECLDAVMADPETAVGLLVSNVLSGFGASEAFAEAGRNAVRRHAKPVAIGSLYAASNHGDFGVRLSMDGVPVIYGAEATMRAAANMLRHRDLRARPAEAVPGASAEAVARWRSALGAIDPDEATALAMMADFGIPAVEARIAEDVDRAIAAAEALGYPVVLKTAVAGIAHKSDIGGVRLGLADAAAVWEAYRDLKARIGPRVLVAPMAGSGCELILGGVVDPKFGPAVVIGVGGIHAEILRETRCLLAPFGSAAARNALEGLAIAPILAGARGRPALDVDVAAEVLSRFSAMLAALAGEIAEIDVNPLLVTESGCLALDALVVPRR